MDDVVTSEIPPELANVMPPLTRRPDHDEFWRRTLDETHRVPLEPTRVLRDYPSPFVKVHDITYRGFDRTPIHGLYLVPAFLPQTALPCIVSYHGFGGNCGHPSSFMSWVMMGVAVLSVDCRDQSGRTGNRAFYTNGAMNVVSKGVLDKEEYYYRAVYMDCVKAVDFAAAQPEVDAKRIIIEGGSQGGGLGTAVCALDERPALAMLDVPSHSNIVKRIQGAHGMFSAVTDYLRSRPDHMDKVYETMSYFDTMNMAERIRCRLLASVGLKDTTCPPECYFATYNRITSPKAVRIYPFAGHEGGGTFHHELKLRFLREFLR
jgi:cephalosporin-C deacetylase